MAVKNFKKILLRLITPVLFNLLIAVTVNGQAAFNHKIYIPSNLDKNVLASVEDMAYWMGKMNSKQYSIHQEPGKNEEGIQLQWLESSDLPVNIKKQVSKDGQSFYLIIKERKYARIIGTGGKSFINGIYTFLHELGFRWYMPGDVWTKIPDLKNVNKNINKVYTPSFQSRSYFGTGGIGPIPGIDDKNTFKKDYDDWNRRNRLSTDFDGKGHLGQVFYKENKEVLDKNPSYFCNGKVNKYGRIDIANAEAVDLFVKWALGRINYKERFPMVGVDPADGSGGKDDCLPQNMKGITSYSDKYFWLANKVAEKLDADKAAAMVQTYAYASHAAPPSFDMNSRVYTIIIPYAFQRITEPVEFIKLWSKKVDGRPMGLYDYWNITQWSKGEPQFNIYNIPEKLKLWSRYNINFIRIESTNAKGPMGHAWWLASQMMWDVNQSFEDLYKEFLEANFGEAAADIKNMYDRWSLNYQGVMDVSFSMENLSRASARTKDPLVQKRINELKAYVVYLEKYHAYISSPTIPGYNDLIQYINSIHHLRLLQTRPLQVSYIKPPAGYTKSTVEMKVERKNTSVKSLSDNDIEKKFQEINKNAPAAYGITDFRFDVKKASYSKSPKKPYYSPTHINGTNVYTFYLPTKRKLSFQAGATKPTRFSISDKSGKKWLEGKLKASETNNETISIELPAGIYSLKFGELYRFSRFIFPKDISLFTSNTFYDNMGYPLQYVYVPKGVNEIVYKDSKGPRGKRGFWIDPNGKTAMPEKIKLNIYRVKVPAAQQGKVWVLNIGHRTYELLNLPNLFSLNEFEYAE